MAKDTRTVRKKTGNDARMPASADFDAVRDMFTRDIEFDSERHLLTELNKSGRAMPAKDLAVVLERFIGENKIHVDGKSLIWIDAAHNKKLLAILKNAVSF